jgi:hypothetical protein
MIKHLHIARALGVIGVSLSIGIALPSRAQPKVTGQNQYGIGLGKLLTTERERVKIDNLRFNIAPAPVKVQAKEVETPVYIEPPKPWRIEGISNRPSRPPGQRVSVWIEGQVYTEEELPKGLSIVRNSQGEVIGLNSIVSKSKVEFAKIGDSITRPQTAEEAKAIELAANKPKPPPEKPAEKPAEMVTGKPPLKP